MKTLSSLILSVFAYLGPLGRLKWQHPCCRKMSWKWLKFIEKTCFIPTFALILVAESSFPHENSVSLRCFTTYSLTGFISCNSDNSVQTVIIIGNMYSLWENHVVNMFLGWILHYNQCLGMTTLSRFVLSMFAYLGPVGRLQWESPCCRNISWKWVKFIEKTCFIRTFALIVVAQSLYPHENNVSLSCCTTYSLKHFINCNGDNDVQTVIFIGNACIL